MSLAKKEMLVISTSPAPHNSSLADDPLVCNGRSLTSHPALPLMAEHFCA